jgi:hypothetical protein
MKLGKALATGFAEEVETDTEVESGLARVMAKAAEGAAPDTVTVPQANEEPVAEIR